MNQFLWAIFPYLMFTVFIVGHIFRYNSKQMEWSAKSSQFLEKKSLRWGAIMFHIGIFMVFAGHVVGLLIPKSVTAKLGMSEEMYHLGATLGGGFAGILALVGVTILLTRRLTNKRVRATSRIGDYVSIILLAMSIVVGVFTTFFGRTADPNFDYRETVSPWVRQLFTFSPDASLMKDVPLYLKLHIILAFALVGVWPFTRLVHVWSVPIAYLKRSPLIYRKRK